MHRVVLPSEAEGRSLVYVWGYPLLLSLVYRTVGFDMQNYSTLIYYCRSSVKNGKPACRSFCVPQV